MSGREALVARIEAARVEAARVEAAQRSAASGLALFVVGIDHLGSLRQAFGEGKAQRIEQRFLEHLALITANDHEWMRLDAGLMVILRSAIIDAEQALSCADQIRLLCRDDLVIADQLLAMRVSVGVALEQADIDSEQWLAAALRALHQAHREGGDRCHVLRSQHAVIHGEAQQRLAEIERAVATQAMRAWFMPIVDLQRGDLLCYEALVRWQREDGSIEPPDQFLPLVRGRRLANLIDLQMIDQAVNAMHVLPPGIGVTVNINAETLSEPGFVTHIQRRLEKRNVRPDRLMLEITETTLLKLDPYVCATIDHVSALGIRWLLDDFGVGFSSISHLRDLPIHGLKLDRSFASAIDQGDQKSLHLAQGLAGLAQGLALRTIAEGIESSAASHCLQQLGWHSGQGWYYGKAAPIEHWNQAALHLRPAPDPNPLMSLGNWSLAVTESIPVGLFTLRRFLDGQVLVAFASQRCRELLRLGEQSPQMLPVDLLNLVDREDRSLLEQAWRELDASSPQLVWEGRIHWPDKPTWLRLEIVGSRMADGTLTLQGVMSDITERKTHEMHLRRLLDEAPIPIAIQELTGDDPKITYMNRQFTRVYGYDVHTTPTLSVWACQAYPDPTYRQKAFAIWGEALAKAEAAEGAVESMEFNVVTLHGEIKHMHASPVVIGHELIISAVDLTDFRNTQRQLAEVRAAEAEVALAITEAIPVGTYTMVQPPQGGIGSFAFMSDRFLAICGLDREVARSDPFRAFACVHPDDYDEWVRLNAEVFANKTSFYGECRLVVDGQTRWISAESVPRDLEDGCTVWEGVLIDITQRKQIEQEHLAANRRLRHFATTDALTGCSNRRHLEELIEASIKAQINDQRSLSLILLDIDSFKSINDGYGHPVGDRVLVEVVRRITEAIAPTHSLGRWGGEEFLLLASGLALSQAVPLAEELRHRIAASRLLPDREVTASFGVAERGPGEAVDAWLRRVDRCLYVAKSRGRNRVVSEADPSGSE